jgi:hypothetical protein
MVVAAIVVFDFFDGVPKMVTHSPVVMELTCRVTVLVNAVVEVQFTVVCPVLGFCTSIDVPEIEATDPLAPPNEGAAAAPAIEAMAMVAIPHSANAPAVRIRPLCPTIVCSPFGRSLIAIIFYSLLNASIGARWAARLAG